VLWLPSGTDEGHLREHVAPPASACQPRVDATRRCRTSVLLPCPVGPGASACVAVSASLVRRGQDRSVSIRTLRREDHRGSAACKTRAGNCGDVIQSSREGLDDARRREDNGPCPHHQYPRSCPGDRGGSRALGSRDAGVPQPHMLRRLSDTLRTPPRGAVGWRWCPAKLDRQPACWCWRCWPCGQPRARPRRLPSKPV